MLVGRSLKCRGTPVVKVISATCLKSSLGQAESYEVMDETPTGDQVACTGHGSVVFIMKDLYMDFVETLLSVTTPLPFPSFLRVQHLDGDEVIALFGWTFSGGGKQGKWSGRR